MKKQVRYIVFSRPIYPIEPDGKAMWCMAIKQCEGDTSHLWHKGRRVKVAPFEVPAVFIKPDHARAFAKEHALKTRYWYHGKPDQLRGECCVRKVELPA